MRKVVVIVVLALTLGGCSYFQTLKDTPAFKEFCSWSGTAIQGIGAAVIESSNDPAKQKVTVAMSQALVFLKLAAAQCPPDE